MIDPRKVLFSKTLGRGEDSISIHIECESNLDLTLPAPHSVSIHETVNGGVPVVVVSFTDAAGDLVNIRNLDSTQNFLLHIGTTEEVMVRDVPLVISSIEFQNTVSGQAKHVLYEVTFAHRSWKDFSLTSHARGWNNVRWSDVVSSIIDIPSDITPTDGVQLSVVQPQWTNMKMLQWIAKRAVSSSGLNNYVYAVRLDGTFFFKPLSELYTDINHNFGRLGDRTDPLTFIGREKTHRNLKQGASGIISSSYDYEQGSYVREVYDYEDVNSPSLSDWTLIDSHSTPHLHQINGRDEHAEELAKNRIAKTSDSFQTLRVMSHAVTTIGVRVGQTVDLTLVSYDDMETNSAFSENYSGKYVVAASTISMKDHKRKTFLQVELTLIRQGINDSDKRNYLRGH